MLMQALFSRGGHPIHWNINGFNYTFTRNDAGDFVCPVYSGEHRSMMVKTGNFAVYVPKEKEPETVSGQWSGYVASEAIIASLRENQAPETVTEPVQTKIRKRGGRRAK